MHPFRHLSAGHMKWHLNGSTAAHLSTIRDLLTQNAMSVTALSSDNQHMPKVFLHSLPMKL